MLVDARCLRWALHEEFSGKKSGLGDKWKVRCQETEDEYTL